MTFMTGIAVMLGIGAVVSVMMVIEAINTRAGKTPPVPDFEPHHHDH